MSYLTSWASSTNYIILFSDILLCLSSIEVETYCFTSHRSVVRPISFVYVRSLRLSCRRSNTRCWPNAGLLLAHRLRRWANISPVLGYCVVFDATLNVGQRHRRQANINPAFVFDLNRHKSLKNKQKTATRHTGTLECGTQQALVLTNVGPLSTTLAQN